MKIVIAGGSGFLGTPLAWTWAEEGHDVRILTRALPVGQAQHESGTGRPGITRVGWRPDGTAATVGQELERADAVINLAGESIADGRWTTTRKDTLRNSRLRATRSLVEALAATREPPHTFVSSSAIGYYGDRGADLLTEEASPGDDFIARLCVEWEHEAMRAARPGIRVVPLRTGLVLERSGGALAKMVPPFRACAGGQLGSGRQYMSWVHRLDWIELVRFIVDMRTIEGPVNATAPHPVTNAQFSHALGHALRRPSMMRVPAFVLKLMLGELAESLLTGQRVTPGKALGHGYHFRYPEIEIAFRGIFGD
jgi:uncharacterized protein (TIGR01777 family)